MLLNQNVNNAQKNAAQVMALQEIAKSAHVPAVGYACVELKEENGEHEFSSTSLTVGKKSSTDANASVDGDTRFPAASLSKIVFTYLVLQLVKAGKINLDEHLHDTLEYERFKINGKYPTKVTQLTAQHVLSHTTGLPNVGANSFSTLEFDTKSKLGEEYSYSGEAFIYLQKVIEKKTGKNLEELAQEYVFTPLQMIRSTFSSQPATDANIVSVHNRLGKSSAIGEGLTDSIQPNAAGSLLTTPNDFSKFMAAWLKDIDDPIMKKAFEPTSTKAEEFKTCGLGWHLYKDKETDKVIAYQYGENTGMKSFVAINIDDRKGAAIFTNAEHGMSIGNQLLHTSLDFSTIANLEPVFKHLNYNQSDEPGWQAMLEGDMAEDHNRFDEAREHFKKAFALSPEGESKQRLARRLAWFNETHPQTSEKKVFTIPFEMFAGTYANKYNDEIKIFSKDGSLLYKDFSHEIKLVQVSETEFLPEKNQSIKIKIVQGKMSIYSIDGWEKSLTQVPHQCSQEKMFTQELFRGDRTSQKSSDSESIDPDDDARNFRYF